MDSFHELEPAAELSPTSIVGRGWRRPRWVGFALAVLGLTYVVSAEVVPSLWHGWHNRDAVAVITAVPGRGILLHRRLQSILDVR